MALSPFGAGRVPRGDAWAPAAATNAVELACGKGLHKFKVRAAEARAHTDLPGHRARRCTYCVTALVPYPAQFAPTTLAITSQMAAASRLAFAAAR